MGGSNETTINGLRMHVNNGEVHVHDDKSSLKASFSASVFKKEMKDALEKLEDNDGVVDIPSRGATLLVTRYCGNISLSLINMGNKKTDIKNFIESI